MAAEKSRPRILWLDSSRGICFLMVIYSHLQYCNYGLMIFFAPVFLTTFFFVSGYLYKDVDRFATLLEQRTRTLFIPFLLYGSLLLLSRYVFTLHDELTPLPEAYVSFLLQDGKNNLIWFIPSLYVYTLCFYWINKWAKTVDKLLLISIGILIVNWVLREFFGLGYLPYNFSVVGFAIFWMALGHYAAKKIDIAKILDWRRFLILFAIYIAVVALTRQYYNFAGSKYLIDWFIATLAGLYCIVYLSVFLFNKSKFLLYIGANSLICFIFHGKIYSILETLSEKFVIPNILVEDNDWIIDLLGVAITFLDAVLLIIPIYFINRFLPFTVGKGYKLWKP